MSVPLDPKVRLNLKEFSELLQGPEPPQHAEILAYIKSKESGDWSKFLVAAVDVNPSFCHLFPRRANPAYSWRYDDLSQSVSRALQGVREDISENDLVAWKHWLRRWLRERNEAVALREEPFQAIVVALLTGDDLVAYLCPYPSRFVDLYNTSELLRAKLSPHHLLQVAKHSITNLSKDYNAVDSLFRELANDGLPEQLTLEGDDANWKTWLASWFRTKVLGEHVRNDDSVAAVAIRVLDEQGVHNLVQGMEAHELARVVNELRHDGLMRRLVEDAPDEMTLGLREVWRQYRKDHPKEPWATSWSISGVVQALGPKPLIRDSLLLGYSLGVLASEKGISVTSHQFWRGRDFKYLHVSNISELPEIVLLQAKLWSLLRGLATYQEHSWEHRTEILGVNSEIVTFAAAHPESWASASPWILKRSDLLHGPAESVTTLAPSQSSIAEALESLCAYREPSVVRDRALGIRAMLHGLESPGPELVRRVMDIVTTWVDGAQIFPHPLELPASTWLGSLGIEGALRSMVQTAERNFGEFFRSSAGLDEDIHTARLLDELARASKATDLAVRGLASRTVKAPVSRLKYRQAPKRSEEPKYGLDISLRFTCAISE